MCGRVGAGLPTAHVLCSQQIVASAPRMGHPSPAIGTRSDFNALQAHRAKSPLTAMAQELAILLILQCPRRAST